MIVLITILGLNIKEFAKSAKLVPIENKTGKFGIVKVNKMERRMLKSGMLLSGDVGQSLKVEIDGGVNVTQQDYGFIVKLSEVDPGFKDIFTPQIPQPYICNGIFVDVPVLPSERVIDYSGLALTIFIGLLLTIGTTAIYPMVFNMDKKLDVIVELESAKIEHKKEKGENVNDLKIENLRKIVEKIKKKNNNQGFSCERVWIFLSLIIGLFGTILTGNSLLVQMDWPHIMKNVPVGKCFAITGFDDMFKTKNISKTTKAKILAPYKMMKMKRRKLMFDENSLLEAEEATQVEPMTVERIGDRRVRFHTNCGISIKNLNTGHIYTYYTKYSLLALEQPMTYIDEIQAKTAAWCRGTQKNGIKDFGWDSGFSPMKEETYDQTVKVGCGIGGCCGCKRRMQWIVGWRYTALKDWKNVSVFIGKDKLIRYSPDEKIKEQELPSNNGAFWSATEHSDVYDRKFWWIENLTHTILPDIDGGYSKSKGSNLVFSESESEVRNAVLGSVEMTPCGKGNMKACFKKKENVDTHFSRPTNNSCTLDLEMELSDNENYEGWKEWADPCKKALCSVMNGSEGIQISTEQSNFCTVSIKYMDGNANLVAIRIGQPYINPGITEWNCLSSGDGWGTDCNQDQYSSTEAMQVASEMSTYVNSTYYPAENIQLPNLGKLLGLDEIMYAAFAIAIAVVVILITFLVIKYVVPPLKEKIGKKMKEKKRINIKVKKAKTEFTREQLEEAEKDMKNYDEKL